MKVTLFLVLICSICALGQYSNLVERILIDDFTLDQSVVLVLPADVTPSDPPLVESSIVDSGVACSNIIGCERDMFITVTSGHQGRYYTSHVSDNIWYCEAAIHGVGEFLLQFDGRDNSTSLDLNGLNNFDLTDGGLASVIQVAGTVDISGTTLNFIAYSPNGNYCEADIEIMQDSSIYDDTLSFMPLANLTGNCDLTNIGAIEVSILGTVPIDTVIQKISILGQNTGPIERIVIDDFSLNQSVFVILPADQTPYDPPFVESSIGDAGVACSNIIGCERDMFISVTSGHQSRVFFTTVSNDQWAIGTPLDSVAEYLIQYDGRDNSTSLDLNGLNNFDLTDGGLANTIQVPGAVDMLGQVLNFVAYSPNGNVCEGDIDINHYYSPTYYDDTLTFLPLANLTGNCDLTNIGAIEISVLALEAIDPVFRTISIIG